MDLVKSIQNNTQKHEYKSLLQNDIRKHQNMKNEEQNYKKIEKSKIDEQIKKYEKVFSENKSKKLSEMKDNSI